MPEVKGNQIVTDFKETKDVISLGIGLVRAWQLSQEDGVINWTDIANFLPVLPKIGPAIDNIGGIEPEFRVATQEDIDQLKVWLQGEMKELDTEEKMKTFIEGCFGIAMSLWVLIRDFTSTTPSQPTEPTKPADLPQTPYPPEVGGINGGQDMEMPKSDHTATKSAE